MAIYKWASDVAASSLNWLIYNLKLIVKDDKINPTETDSYKVIFEK